MHGFETQRKRGTQRGAHVTSLVCALCVALAPLAQAPRAFAAGPPPKRVLLLPAQVDLAVPRTAASKIVDLVGSIYPLDERVTWVMPEALVAPEAPAKPPKSGRAVRPQASRAVTPRPASSPLDLPMKALETARGDAKANRHAAAIKGYTKALQGLASHIGLLVDFTPYRAAVIERALSFFATGYTDNADEEFLRALALEPDLELPLSARDDARAAFDRVKASVGTANAALTVIAEPAGAEVTVDGRLVDRAPATFSGLPRGEHVVRITADGHAGGGQIVTLGDEEVTVALALTTSPQSEAAAAAVAESPGATAPARTPSGGDGGLGARVRAADFGSAFEAIAVPLTRANDLGAVVMTWARPRSSGRGLVMAALVWVPGEGLAQVAETEVSEDLSGLQLAVLDLAEQAVAAALSFPTAKRVSGRPPIFGGAAPEVAEVSEVAEPRAPERVTPEPAKAPEPESRTYGGGGGSRPVADGPPPSLFAPPVESVKPRRSPRREASYDLDADAEASEGATPFYASWWFWTLTLGVLAGGTTAAVLATQQGNGPNTWRATVTW